MEIASLSDEHQALVNLVKIRLDEKVRCYVRKVLYYSLTIAEQENADKDVVVAAALLHQIVSYPTNDIRMLWASDESADFATNILTSIEEFPPEKIELVADVIRQNSLTAHIPHDTIESKVLHDAIIFASFDKMYTRGREVVKAQPSMMRLIVHEK